MNGFNSALKLMLPERELWLSVLAQCVEDLFGPEPARGSKRWHLRQSAANWIESPSYSPGSLLWICDHLGLDSNDMRKKILGINLQGLRLSLGPVASRRGVARDH
jgi:hypothetical protein